MCVSEDIFWCWSQDMVVLPYKDSLLLFSRYLQQLVMESLGKEYDLDGNLVSEGMVLSCGSSTCLLEGGCIIISLLLLQVNQGLAVYGNKGSTDQHA